MKFMLDTNIIIDVLSQRDGYRESLQLVKYCELGVAEGFVSVITVTDVMYILRKHIDPILVREAIQTLLLIVDVASVSKNDIIAGFNSEMKDYEDAVQVSCAERMKADYIVTRNVKDFEKSPVPAILPGTAINIINGY